VEILVCFIKGLTVLEESLLKTEEDLDGTRFSCFFCNVGMGGDGALCKIMSAVALFEKLFRKTPNYNTRVFQGSLYLINPL